MTVSVRLAMIGSPPADFQAVLRQTISESHATDRVELHFMVG